MIQFTLASYKSSLTTQIVNDSIFISPFFQLITPVSPKSSFLLPNRSMLPQWWVDVWIPHRKQHTRSNVFSHRPHLSSYMQKRHVDGRERSGGGGRAGGVGGENKLNKIGGICWELYKLDESLWIHRRAMA